MSKLIQLANGDWVDPQTVHAVRALPALQCETTGTRHAPLVVVHHGDHGFLAIIDFESMEDAEAYRDQLAGEVNL